MSPEERGLYHLQIVLQQQPSVAKVVPGGPGGDVLSGCSGTFTETAVDHHGRGHSSQLPQDRPSFFFLMPPQISIIFSRLGLRPVPVRVKICPG